MAKNLGRSQRTGRLMWQIKVVKYQLWNLNSIDILRRGFGNQKRAKIRMFENRWLYKAITIAVT